MPRDTSVSKVRWVPFIIPARYIREIGRKKLTLTVRETDDFWVPNRWPPLSPSIRLCSDGPRGFRVVLNLNPNDAERSQTVEQLYVWFFFWAGYMRDSYLRATHEQRNWNLLQCVCVDIFLLIQDQFACYLVLNISENVFCFWCIYAETELSFSASKQHRSMLRSKILPQYDMLTSTYRENFSESC